jgi:capsular exopolysaccharide synthesis family protein
MSKTGKSGFLDAEDLIPVFKFINKNWILIPIFCSVSFVIAYFYSNRMPDIYGAKAEILLKSNETYDYQSKIYSSLGYYSVIQDIANQKRVITSKDLVGRVIDKLNFNLSYYIVGRIKTAQVSNFGSMNIICDWKNFNPRMLNMPFFIKVIDQNRFQLSFDSRGVKIFKECEFNKPIKEGNITLQVDLVKDIKPEEFELIREQTYKFIVHTRDHLISKYASAINVSNNNYSSILTLSINDGLAENAQQFLDTLTKEYIHQTIENQIEINENTLRFIDKQITEMTEIIDSLELILDSYSEENEIVDLTQKEQNAFDQLSKIQLELAENELQLKSTGKIKSKLLDLNSSDLIPTILAGGYQDANLQNMINKVIELRQRRHNFLMDVTPQDSRIVRIDDELVGLTKNINQYISDMENMLSVENNELNSQLVRLEKTLKNIPKSKREMNGIERKLSVNENLYNFLIEKRANTIIARAGIVPETNVVEKARSMGVIGPDRQKYIYISFGVGFILALVVGFLRTMFFERIENTKELKVITRLPVIGGVPFYDQANDFPISIVKAPRSNISESFRSIRTNMQFILGSEGSKVILVSSLHPGEGKTFVTVNIAATLAKADKKVIILDFDLHKPRIHKVFGLSKMDGVSNYLVGQKHWKETVIHHEIKNLDFVLSGPIPPNASELVLSKKIDVLIEELKAEYDYILIDTPPLALISDALVLMNKVNLSFCVLNTQKATKQGVRFLEETFTQNDISHVSLLLNNIKQNRWRYYYAKYAYKYGYGYVYGYGYGYGDGYRYGYSEYADNEDEKKG